MSWENRFERLKQFCEDTGHSKVPQSHPELGTFVMTQRRLYKQGKLLEERQRMLEGINFQWVVYQKSGLKSDRCNGILNVFCITLLDLQQTLPVKM